ncbi:LemA family protein [Caminibacter pacificus]
MNGALLAGVIGILGAAFAVSYHILLFKKSKVEKSEGIIEAYLHQRYDLLPSLIENLKNSFELEKEIIEEIINLRIHAMQAESIDEKIEYEEKISRLIKLLLNKPVLKDIDLHENIRTLENKIAISKTDYNKAVTEYNNALDLVPSNLLAKIMRMKKRKTFEEN